MAASNVEPNTPQWMIDLKIRKKYKNVEKQLSSGSIQPSGLDQHNLASESSGSSAEVSRVVASDGVEAKCNLQFHTSVHQKSKMVQERAWTGILQYSDIENGKNRESDLEDSAEDLQYGPGIVSKLKNRYLSLTLREVSSKTRPSILHMRKATSLEHLLEDEDSNEYTICNGQQNRLSKSRTNGHTSHTIASTIRHHRNGSKLPEMKRARSVETISRTTDRHELENDVSTNKPKRESYHEDMLIFKAEGNDKAWIVDSKLPENTNTKATPHRINKPLMIPRVMNEKEKPPVDVVKQAVKIFEPAKLRSKQPHSTGEVAAKVGLFSNHQCTKKSQQKLKHSSTAQSENNKIPGSLPIAKKLNNDNTSWINKPKSPDVTSLPSPIPDVSRINEFNKVENEDKISSLSETPDLILHSSPSRKNSTLKSTDDFIKAEKEHSSNINITENNLKYNNKNIVESADASVLIKKQCKIKNDNSPNTKPLISNKPSKTRCDFDQTDATTKILSAEAINFSKVNTTTPINIPLHLDVNISQSKSSENRNLISPNLSTNKIPLLLEKNKINESEPNITDKSGPNLTNTIVNKIETKCSLSEQEMKKNLINKTKSESKVALHPSITRVDNTFPSSIKASSNEVPSTIEVPKSKPRSIKEQDNSMLFNFTKRSGGVPDYIQNYGKVSVGKIEKPKPGEGGITLLPGASIDESWVDDDWQKSLEGPPSPCNVTFINDNILIDGKSSLSQKTFKHNHTKNKIKFLEAVPQIFEYPSEASLLDEIPSPPAAPAAATIGHALSNLSGSTLANYTPKTGTSYDDFQLGVTKSTSSISTSNKNGSEPENLSDLVLTKMDEPVVFSAGTNSDILF